MKRRREKQPSAILRNWLGIEDGDLSKFSFYVCLSLVGLARLLLSSDLRLQIFNARHDEALYLTRAYHLLAGEALGPYGPTLLLKLPGFSFLIAAIRSLGLSFVEALNLFFFGAGLYLVSGLRANRIGRWICVLAFATFLLALEAHHEQSTL